MLAKSLKKQVRQYTAVFEKDPEVGGYTVTIPALPGCISEGDTFEEAMENIHEAAELYLEVALEKKGTDLLRDREIIVAPLSLAA